MIADELAEVLRERGATPEQIQTIERNLGPEAARELDLKVGLVSGQPRLEQIASIRRTKFATIVKMSEGKEIAWEDFSTLL